MFIKTYWENNHGKKKRRKRNLTSRRKANHIYRPDYRVTNTPFWEHSIDNENSLVFFGTKAMPRKSIEQRLGLHDGEVFITNIPNFPDFPFYPSPEEYVKKANGVLSSPYEYVRTVEPTYYSNGEVLPKHAAIVGKRRTPPTR